MEKNFVSKISIGSANFGIKYTIDKKKLNKNKIFKILNLAKRNNINSIDTAQSYGNSENIIGEYIKSKFYKKWDITTKITKKKSKIIDLLNHSKINLSVMPKNVLVHNYKDYLNDKFRNDLIELKKKININIGVSIYNDSEIIKVLEKHQPDVVQLPINAINKKLYSTGLIRLLKEQKIIIQSRSIFFQGLFFKNENIIK